MPFEGSGTLLRQRTFVLSETASSKGREEANVSGLKGVVTIQNFLIPSTYAFRIKGDGDGRTGREKGRGRAEDIIFLNCGIRL